jgi:hypothetical protein
LIGKLAEITKRNKKISDANTTGDKTDAFSAFMLIGFDNFLRTYYNNYTFFKIFGEKAQA